MHQAGKYISPCSSTLKQSEGILSDSYETDIGLWCLNNIQYFGHPMGVYHNGQPKGSTKNADDGQ
jgi:hypothetical protein